MNYFSPFLKKEFDKIKNHPLLSIIGHACDFATGCQLVNGLGQQIELTAQGWQSFSGDSN